MQRRFPTVADLEKAFAEWRVTFDDPTNDEIPDIEGFCDFIGAWRDLLCEYEKMSEYTDAVKKIKNWIFKNKKQLALRNKMNPAIFIFDAKNNSGYVDKTEQDITTAGEKLPGVDGSVVDAFIANVKNGQKSA